MFRKVLIVVAVLGLILGLAACGKKEETAVSKEPAAAVPEKPKVVPGEMVLIPAGEFILGTNQQDAFEAMAAGPQQKMNLPASVVGPCANARGKRRARPSG